MKFLSSIRLVHVFVILVATAALYLATTSSFSVTQILAGAACAAAIVYSLTSQHTSISPGKYFATLSLLSLVGALCLSASSYAFVGAACVFVLATFWFGQERIAELKIEQERSAALAQARVEHFIRVFPAISNIPVLGYVVRYVRREGWPTMLVLFFLTILSASLILYALAYRDLYEDEYQVVSAATSYYTEGTFYKWNWIRSESAQATGCQESDSTCHYTRAWPHTWLIAQAYHIFGISEWSSRIVSALFGILFVPLLYITSRFFTESRSVALAVTAAAVLYPSYLSLFRYARMYAVLLPLFLLLTLVTYHTISVSSVRENVSSAIGRFLSKNLRVRYFAAFIAIMLLLLTATIHINALIIVPSTIAFCIAMMCITRERTWIALSLFGMGGVLAVTIAYYTGAITAFQRFFSFFEVRNTIYLEYLTRYPVESAAGTVLLATSLVIPWLIHSRLRAKLLFLISIVGVSLVFFVFVADRYASFPYISHITPIALILILFVGAFLVRLSGSRIVMGIVFLFFLATISARFVSAIPSLYSDDTNYGRYTQAYQVILEQYKPGKEAIFAQYPRSFYLRELADADPVIISMLANRQYSFETFTEQLAQYESGYITWETRKTYHLSPAIVTFVRNTFEQHHGKGKDNTNVEVYYYNADMLSAPANEVTQ